MKRIICMVICLVLLLGATVCLIYAFPNPVSRAKQAVVGALEGVGYDAEGNPYSVHSNGMYSTGTAFGVSPAGNDAQYFATNCHVVTGSDSNVSIYLMIDGSDLYDGSTMIPCEVIYTDEEVDLAIVKTAQPVKGVGTLPIRPIKAVSSGRHVYALGFPGIADEAADENLYTMGDITVTDGIVSRLLTSDGVRALAHTADINHGNSGGPLVDDYGQVLGINSFGIIDRDTADKRNYAIYSDYIMEALDRLDIPYETGSDRPYLRGVITAAVLIVLAIAFLLLAALKPRARRRKPTAALRAINGPLAGKSWKLYDKLSMGRGSDQDIRLPDDTRGVSRAHCILQSQGSALTLTDLQSSCGTFLNGQQLSANQPTPVTPGAIIALGSDTVTFQLEYPGD